MSVEVNEQSFTRYQINQKRQVSREEFQELIGTIRETPMNQLTTEEFGLLLENSGGD